MLLGQAAAKRWAIYWNKRVEVFGPDMAFIPLTLEGALKDDHVVLSVGRMQITGKKDPDGRAIIFLDFSKDVMSKDETLSLVRACWYILHVALEDEDVQKQGAVFLTKTVCSFGQWNLVAGKGMADSVKGAIPIRFGGLHICQPPLFVNALVNIAKILLGSKLRNRIYVQSGSEEEVLGELAKYGIGKDKVPEIWGGDLILDQSKWLADRQKYEDGQAE
jgi:hypothetical protein